jgi:hypothetical protein
MADKTRGAVLGLGSMGTGMAGQSLVKGFDLTVFNRSPLRAESLRPPCAKIATTPRAAVKEAMFVISMLADDAASRAVWMGTDGALAGVVPGAVLIESGKISVGWARRRTGQSAVEGDFQAHDRSGFHAEFPSQLDGGGFAVRYSGSPKRINGFDDHDNSAGHDAESRCSGSG